VGTIINQVLSSWLRPRMEVTFADLGTGLAHTVIEIANRGKTNHPCSGTHQLQIARRPVNGLSTHHAQSPSATAAGRRRQPEDWARILDEIAENDNVPYHRDDGVQLFWTVPKDD
jgi:hypothetical protein